MSDEYYIRLRGQVQGPFTQERLQSLARRQRFTRVHQVSTDKVTWSPASKFPELFPPPPPKKERQAPAEVQAEDSGGYQLAMEPDAGQPTGAAQPVDAGQPDGAAFAGESLASEVQEWFCVRRGQEGEIGPLSIRELRELAEFGELHPGDYLWKAGMAEWVEAGGLPEIFGAAPAAAVQEQPMDAGAAGAYGAANPAGPTCTLAYVSLGLGIGGVTVLPFAGSIGAVICGHLALKQIRREGLLGRGLALTGLILGYASIALTILSLFIVLLVLILQKA